MTRARWLIGLLVAAAALVVAAQALATYIAGRLVVGVAAVIVLMAVLVIGLASLGRARRYVERELRALHAEPPGGELLGARRRQLEELHRRGAIADLDALADATSAQEAERGYAGKYLVATTVLIGLVGTFGGLMETLRRLPPLLTGDGAGTLALLAGPLAGLHVTFGASVVAILVTLALALVQGDVTLHHGRLLALLEERTRHRLFPALWPARDGAAERTARELAELRALIEGALATGVESTTAKVGAVVHDGTKRLVDEVSGALRAHGAAQTAAMQTAGAAVADGLRRATEEMSVSLGRGAAALGEAAAASRQSLADAVLEINAAVRAGEEHAREEAWRVARSVEAAAAASAETTRAAMAALSGDVGAQLTRAMAAVTEQSRTLLAEIAAQMQRAIAATTEQSRALQAEVGAQMAHAAAGMEAAAQTVASLAQRSTQALETGGQAVFEGLRAMEGDAASRLDRASASLGDASADLRGALEALSPAVGDLVPQLAALAEELALLAARAENAEQSSAVLDELARLGEDVERLTALARPDGPAGHESSAPGAPAPLSGASTSPSDLPAPPDACAPGAGAGEEEPRA
jgi:hypothetical protein